MNDIIEAFNTIAAALDRYADRLEYRITGGAPAKPLVYDAVDDLRYLASVVGVDTGPAADARGEAAIL